MLGDDCPADPTSIICAPAVTIPLALTVTAEYVPAVTPEFFNVKPIEAAPEDTVALPVASPVAVID